MTIQRIAFSAITGLLLAVPPAVAHGGQYRGPGDTVPPGGGRGGGRSSGPGGPTTPGPGGPTTPTPGGPTAPGPQTPTGPAGAGPRRGPTTGGPRGVQLGNDLSQWQFWWEFNKDPFLQLKAKIHERVTVTGSDDFVMGRGLRVEADNTLAPSERDLKASVIPALKKALDDPAGSRDIVSSCMVALAKIGRDPSILQLLREHLADRDQEQRETAALAMGIAAVPQAVDDLVHLAKDTETGRRLCARSNGVDFRTRSFACYGLGLIAHAQDEIALKRKVFDVMVGILDSGRKSRRDAQVAAIHALRLLNPDPSTEEGKQLRDRTVACLVGFLDNDEIFDQIRAHAYQAIARLVGRDDRTGAFKNRLLRVLQDRRQRHWIHQSAILALGQMASVDDSRVSEAIQDYMQEGRNLQAKYFCAIALGQIGGEKNRNFLRTRLLRSRTQSIRKPWIALGLAILDHDARKLDPSRSIDSTAYDIRREYEELRNPILASGLAIALGIMRDKDAGDILLDRMLEYRNQSEPAGYHAVALGLMDFAYAKSDISALVEKATRRPVLLAQCSIALGLLGDKEIGLRLLRRMKEQNTVAVFSALAQAIGFIGDRRVLRGLVQLLGDKDLQPLNRAFAAVALGLIGDKEDLPWNSKIAVDINYRANVETLTNRGGTGILDIL